MKISKRSKFILMLLTSSFVLISPTIDAMEVDDHPTAQQATATDSLERYKSVNMSLFPSQLYSIV